MAAHHRRIGQVHHQKMCHLQIHQKPIALSLNQKPDTHRLYKRDQHLLNIVLPFKKPSFL